MASGSIGLRLWGQLPLIRFERSRLEGPWLGPETQMARCEVQLRTRKAKTRRESALLRNSLEG
jgi:hypothetical protein